MLTQTDTFALQSKPTSKAHFKWFVILASNDITIVDWLLQMAPGTMRKSPFVHCYISTLQDLSRKLRGHSRQEMFISIFFYQMIPKSSQPHKQQHSSDWRCSVAYQVWNAILLIHSYRSLPTSPGYTWSVPGLWWWRKRKSMHYD